MSKAAFLGLGTMGYPMAGHLVRAGHDVCVFNRTPARADAWLAEHGARKAASPAEAARGCAFVFACVGGDEDVREITLGDSGAFASMGEGALFIDHTTASASLARDLAGTARASGLGFLDAPVSGGQSGALEGTLTIMCGGDAAHFASAAPLMNAYAQRCAHMGSSGAGQLAKMVNQICVAGLLQGLAEGVHFARKAGLDPALLFEVLGRGAAQSWQMDNRAATMARGAYDFGFAVNWMRKDLRLCLEEAQRNGARLPVTALVDQFYGDLQATGSGRQDTSSLLLRLEPPAPSPKSGIQDL